MTDKIVYVECYAGYKGDERPVRLRIADQMLDILEIEDRWYSPGATFFRVLLANGERYILRRQKAQDTWTLEAFRSAS
ncbi:MAG TPA: hypothetical protein VKQ28_06300 [Candidatus Acidoferrum sp.]|nr:hypothetical protein [Candidatus Acidoferrum sp.]